MIAIDRVYAIIYNYLNLFIKYNVVEVLTINFYIIIIMILLLLDLLIWSLYRNWLVLLLRRLVMIYYHHPDQQQTVQAQVYCQTIGVHVFML